MNANVQTLILERLRRIGDKLDLEIGRNMETRERLGHLEQGLGPVEVRIASVGRRVDRIDHRPGRTEQRLDSEHAR